MRYLLEKHDFYLTVSLRRVTGHISPQQSACFDTPLMIKTRKDHSSLFMCGVCVCVCLMALVKSPSAADVESDPKNH